MKREGFLFVVVLLVLLGMSGYGCQKGSDSEKIAQELADKLSDAFDFENSTDETGTPPEGSDASDVAQISHMNAPSNLQLGEVFTVDLATDFQDPSVVVGAIVYVHDSQNHIKIWGHPINGQLQLAGLLRDDKDLLGKDFVIDVAFLMVDGRVGVYHQWQLHIGEEPLQTQGYPIEGVEIDGEEWHEGGRPGGSESDSAPQIADIVNPPSSVVVGEEVPIVIRTGDFQGNVVAVLLSTPGNAGYKRTTQIEVSPAKARYSITFGLRINDPRFVGNRVVLMIALESESGSVGLWAPLSFDVSGSAGVDGDEEEIEVEEEIEPEPEPEIEIEEEDVVEEVEPEPDMEPEVEAEEEIEEEWEVEIEPEIEYEEESVAEPVWNDEVFGRMWQLQVDPANPHMSNLNSAISYCENLSWAGFDDWHLPTIVDLRTLVRGCPYTEFGGDCGIDDSCINYDDACNDLMTCSGCTQGSTCYWPDELGHDCYQAWSLTMVLNSGDNMPTNAWVIDFSTAAIQELEMDQNAVVMCVRDTGGAPTETVWIDDESQFMWQIPDEDYGIPAETWQDAIAYCENLEWGGFDDWHLPDIWELRSLIAGCDATATYGSCGITADCSSYSCMDSSCNGCGTSTSCYWSGELSDYISSCLILSSSTPVDGVNQYWAVNFGDGSIIHLGESIQNTFICVRNLQQPVDGDEEYDYEEPEYEDFEYEYEAESEEEVAREIREPNRWEFWPTNDCVMDKNTNLIWELNPDPSAYCTNGTCTPEQAEQYCAAIDKGMLPPHTWRLPTVNELMTLAYYGFNIFEEKSFDPVLFIDDLDGAFASGGEYFLSSTHPRFYQDVAGVNFVSGAVSMVSNGWVRCVAEPVEQDFKMGYTPTVRANSEFVPIDPNNPTQYLDRATGLVWGVGEYPVNQVNGCMGDMCTYTGAAAYCSDIPPTDGYSWRLPTVKELAYLHDYYNSAGYNQHIFYNLQGDKLWSATKFTDNAGTYFIWTVNLMAETSNFIEAEELNVSAEYRVMCVRDSDTDPDFSIISRFWTTSNTVLDSKTGVVWMRSLPTTFTGCTDPSSGTPCTFEDAMEFCETYGNDPDAVWQVPSFDTLFSIIDPQFVYSDPITGSMTNAFNPEFFNYQVPVYQFWTSDFATQDSAWLIRAGGMDLHTNGFSSQSMVTEPAAGVICAQNDVQYIDLQYDPYSEVVIQGDLVWQRYTPTATSGCGSQGSQSCTFEDARMYCETFSSDSIPEGKWRLPNIHELAGLLRHDSMDSLVDTSAFPNIDPYNTSGRIYWSSDAFPGDVGMNQLGVDFASGAIRPEDVYNDGLVICVASIEDMDQPVDGDWDSEELEEEMEYEEEMELDSESESETVTQNELFKIDDVLAGYVGTILGADIEIFDSARKLAVVYKDDFNNSVRIGYETLPDNLTWSALGEPAGNTTFVYGGVALVADADIWIAGDGGSVFDIYHAYLNIDTFEWREAGCSMGYDPSYGKLIDIVKGMNDGEFYITDSSRKLYLYYTAVEQAMSLPEPIDSALAYRTRVYDDGLQKRRITAYDKGVFVTNDDSTYSPICSNCDWSYLNHILDFDSPDGYADIWVLGRHTDADSYFAVSHYDGESVLNWLFPLESFSFDVPAAVAIAPAETQPTAFVLLDQSIYKCLASNVAMQCDKLTSLQLDDYERLVDLDTSVDGSVYLITSKRILLLAGESSF